VLNRLLRSFLRPYARPLLIVVGLQLVGTMASLYLPSLNADIIDSGIARGDTGYILSVGGWMLVVTLVQVVCSIGAVFHGARTATGFGRDVRGAVFGRVSDFSAREVNHFGAPSLITRSTNDVQQVQMLVLTSCTMLVSAPIMCVGGVVMALREDVGLSWLVAVCVPVLVVAIGLVIVRMVPQFRLMQVRIDAVNRILREQITGVRVVRAFVREPQETERFGRANTGLTDVAVVAGRLQALIFPIVMLVLNASSVAVLWFGAERIDAGQMQIGALTAFLQYLLQILMAVMMATFMAIMIPRAAVCADRIVEVLDTDPSVHPPAAPVAPARLDGVVEFDGAGFRYPGAAAPVLSGVTFTARPGETTAVIGSTGAGKSTLVSLVPRLFDATEGAVRVDGVDVREREPAELLARIGWVPQKAFLFSGTIASNLRMGAPDATDAELWRALEIAQAAGFVRERGPRRADRPGRHQRLRRAAAAARDRPRARPPARGVRVRRRVLRARPQHRRPAARRARPGDPRRHGDRRGAARVDRARRRPDRGARGRARGRHRPTRRADGALPDLPGDRGLADGGHCPMSTATPVKQDAETAEAARGMANARRGGGPPWAGVGQPSEKPSAFGPSARRLVGRLAPERWGVLAVLLLGVVSTALNVVGPLLLGAATDVIFTGVVGRSLPAGLTAEEAAERARASGDGTTANLIEVQGVVPGVGIDFPALGAVLLGVIALYVGAALFGYAQGYLLNGVVQRVVLVLRRECEEKLHRLPLRYLDAQQRGEILSRVTNDVDNVSTSLQQTLSQLLTSLLTLVGVLVMMLVVSPLLTVVALVAIPLSLGLTAAIARRSQPQFVAQWRHTGRLNALIEESFTGHELVRAFGRREQSDAEFARRNDDLHDASFRAQFVSGTIMPSMMFLGNLTYVFVAVVGGLQVAGGTLSLGAVQAFIQYSRQFTQPLTTVASMANLLQSGVASAERVFGLLDADEQSPDPAAPPCARSGAGGWRSRTCRSGTGPTPRSSRTCRWWPSPARPSRSSGPPARARPRWSTWSCASTSSTPGGSPSTASTPPR
jgi:ATP-binding cassette subfamily B protein